MVRERNIFVKVGDQFECALDSPWKLTLCINPGYHPVPHSLPLQRTEKKMFLFMGVENGMPINPSFSGLTQHLPEECYVCMYVIPLALGSHLL